ncbi:octaprenyl-diphosphate synthase [Oleiphilus messinensis]|uniref:Octaprenyl diphosphate synthase n=1 Tax=Oleiphilus messinensis TaxID=141451 RepID=A0A1Y0I546_9GAMM|nr:polyprenyl synthetase family protein [Oleiphilus messinensis]ARU54906.1 octaprenyl-diphosphate synthase [Oleiphilus messinensis]
MQAAQIYELVNEDFEGVNSLINAQLSSNVPMVEKIGQYIVTSGGKRMRPLIVILIANALGYDTQKNALKLAAIIEFLHTATLLHDDVVDASDLRRGKSTANAKWGNAPSVLVGDFLYSRAFQMMVELESMEVMKILAHATNVIAEGEVLQLMNVKNPNVSEAHYMEVIRCKTAMLFQAASHSAAALCHIENQTQSLRDYGLHLGLAFQLIDDVLDYRGDASVMGKNVGDDLAEGKPTLPLIYTMAKGTHAQQELIRGVIRKGGLEDIEDVLAAVTESGALDYTATLARQHSSKAKDCLNSLPDTPYKTALESLCSIAVERSY